MLSIFENVIDMNIKSCNFEFFRNNIHIYKMWKDELGDSIIKKCALLQFPELFYWCLHLGYDSSTYKEYYELFSSDNKKYIQQIDDLINKKASFIRTGIQDEKRLLEGKLTISELQDLLDKALINFDLLPFNHLNKLGWEIYLDELLLHGYTRETSQTYRIESIPRFDFNFRSLKIVVFSDTHNVYPDLPPGDILIFCGDCCTNKKMNGNNLYSDFIDYFSKQPHPYKFLIPGNHDILDLQDRSNNRGIFFLNNKEIVISPEGRDLIKFYGVSAIPFRKDSHNNSYSCSRRDMHYLLENIPHDIDVLITHFPPWGIGDYNTNILKAAPYDSGDYYLRKIVLERDIKYHVFGHAHGSTGIYKVSNKNTIFINAAQTIYTFEI